MNNKILLTQALKILGRNPIVYYGDPNISGVERWYAKLAKYEYFDPFQSNGDAFKLACKLSEKIETVTVIINGVTNCEGKVVSGKDRERNTRYAIIKAAAEYSRKRTL